MKNTSDDLKSTPDDLNSITDDSEDMPVRFFGILDELVDYWWFIPLIILSFIYYHEIFIKWVLPITVVCFFSLIVGIIIFHLTKKYDNKVKIILCSLFGLHFMMTGAENISSLYNSYYGIEEVKVVEGSSQTILSGDQPPETVLNANVIFTWGVDDLGGMSVRQYVKSASESWFIESCVWDWGGWFSEDNEYDLICDSVFDRPFRFKFNVLRDAALLKVYDEVDGQEVSAMKTTMDILGTQR